jgi:hypothetical protein
VSYILKTFLEALVGVVLGLLLVFSLGGGSPMCGRLGVSGSVLGQIFALVTWALLITLTVTLVSWIVNRALAR